MLEYINHSLRAEHDGIAQAKPESRKNFKQSEEKSHFLLQIFP